MITPPTDEDVALAMNRHTVIDVHLELPSITVLASCPSAQAMTLANAVQRIADDEPNRAVAMLIGAALSHAAVRQDDHAALSLLAAVHLLAGVTRSQLLGVVQ